MIARTIVRTAATLTTVLNLAVAQAQTAAPEVRITFADAPEVVFRPSDGCENTDVPDVPARAIRDVQGRLVVFALHYHNRPLRGPSLNALKVDCRESYPSRFNRIPSAYESGSWIAGLWTRDGKSIEAIVHHEYHADFYKTCRTPAGGLPCWYNTILAARSDDGGATFRKHDYPVIAAAPFPQDVDQTRHRGFFNPSNIFSKGAHTYFFAAETGWQGQPHGVCLFRSSDPSRPRSWRAWDGRDFTIRYDDPYRPGLKQPATCKPVEPFPAQVGAVVRHRASGVYIAVVQVWKDAKYYPVSGFYYAASRNLTIWSAPRLLMATKTLYDDACNAGEMNSYPSILDPAAEGRNFDDVGAEAFLYWANMRIDGCQHTGDRKLMRRRMVIELLRTPAR